MCAACTTEPTTSRSAVLLVVVCERYARICGLKSLNGIYLVLLHFVECDVVRPHSREKSEVEVLRWYMVFYGIDVLHQYRLSLV